MSIAEDTAPGDVDVYGPIADRLRRGHSVDQVVAVGERTGWWTAEQVYWVADGREGAEPGDGPPRRPPVDVVPVQSLPPALERIDQWAHAHDTKPPIDEGTAPARADAVGTAPEPSGSGHGVAGPQVSPSRTHLGEDGERGASDAPAALSVAGVDVLALGLEHPHPAIRAKAKLVVRAVDELCSALTQAARHG